MDNKELNEIKQMLTKIDLAITGDPIRGVTGVRQHIEKLESRIDQHTKDDHVSFLHIGDRQTSIESQIDQAKNRIAGAMFVFGGFITFAVFIINLYFKAYK